MTGVDDDALATWVRAVLPDGVWSRAGAADIVTELRSVLRHDHPSWVTRLDALTARFTPAELPAHLNDADARWFASLVGQIGVAMPGAWTALGWAPSAEPMPVGTDLPEEVVACVVDRRGLTSRYDAIIVGSGAGGGIAAQELAQSGRTVLVVERGGMPSTPELARDHLRTARADAGLGALAGLPVLGNPHAIHDELLADPTAARWSIGAFGLGGGTRVSGAQAWRYAPQDFALASTYGVPEGSSLADWPVTYDDLEPYYAHAEFEWGVSGAQGHGINEGHRSAPFPLPPMPRTRPSGVLREAAERLGWTTQSVPLLINSEPYRGRPACVRCAQCIGF
ncbi:MAG: NAD(P)-binding protein, partial [Demequina sp.]|uniref:NAD(P)-binding protein n=1 Tax=Demequina sp. TaxID=2050685 RepID=UPI003A8B2A74